MLEQTGRKIITQRPHCVCGRCRGDGHVAGSVAGESMRSHTTNTLTSCHSQIHPLPSVATPAVPPSLLHPRTAITLPSTADDTTADSVDCFSAPITPRNEHPSPKSTEMDIRPCRRSESATSVSLPSAKVRETRVERASLPATPPRRDPRTTSSLLPKKCQFSTRPSSARPLSTPCTLRLRSLHRFNRGWTLRVSSRSILWLSTPLMPPTVHLLAPLHRLSSLDEITPNPLVRSKNDDRRKPRHCGSPSDGDTSENSLT